MNDKPVHKRKSAKQKALDNIRLSAELALIEFEDNPSFVPMRLTYIIDQLKRHWPGAQ